MKRSLPIDPILPDIVASLEKNPCLVLQASPGSGKTTRVPPALMNARYNGNNGRILVLEPRRLAAKYAARWVAEEMGGRVGGTVGYQFRFENVSGPETRILFLTEGMLMRRLLNDRELSGVTTVILDEFHERHLHGDVALAYVRRLQKTRRPDLRLVIMSATLEISRVAAFLGDCPIIQSEVRQFPVDIRYLSDPKASTRHLDVLVRNAVTSLPRGGDCLVFLPGMGDIRRTESAIEGFARGAGWDVFPLHAELPREAQDLALKKSARPKIILSTNVAETSLTIDGITTVIDSGLHRQASYSWWSGIPALRTRPVSRASATQRAGRAGRTGPGTCLRLYTRADFDGRPPFETPEIQRADIAQTVLELKLLGIRDYGEFPWFEPPKADSLAAASELLYRLGATESLEPAASLTRLGHRMAEIPAHPRLARMLLEGARLGVPFHGATLAALISDGKLETLDALDSLGNRFVDDQTRRTRKLFLDAMGGKPGEAAGVPSHEERLRVAQAVLAGFPDRVAKKRDPAPGTQRVKAGEVELVLSAGGSARVDGSGVAVGGATFVALDIQERKTRGQVKGSLHISALVPIHAEWLFDIEPPSIEEREEISWDKEKQKVVAVSTMNYGQLRLAESWIDPKASDEVARILLKEGLGVSADRAEKLTLHEWLTVLGRTGQGEIIEAALARLALARAHYPDWGIPEIDGKLHGLILPALAGKRGLKELKDLDWVDALTETVAGRYRGKMNEMLPLSLTLPGGRRTQIHYALGKPPWVESRLQDFFGMKAGPMLLGGRLPLTIHLLAPNQRAVQVTSDLSGFWQRSYPLIRKELCRKYPRHSWPEDPTTAKPPKPPAKRR